MYHCCFLLQLSMDSATPFSSMPRLSARVSSHHHHSVMNLSVYTVFMIFIIAHRIQSVHRDILCIPPPDGIVDGYVLDLVETAASSPECDCNV